MIVEALQLVEVSGSFASTMAVVVRTDPGVVSSAQGVLLLVTPVQSALEFLAIATNLASLAAADFAVEAQAAEASLTSWIRPAVAEMVTW